jgi:hypothetical protein
MNSYFTDQRSVKSSSDVQRLSMAIPMAPSSDARTSHSPNGKCVSIWNMLSTTFYLGNPGLDGKQIKEF